MVTLTVFFKDKFLHSCSYDRGTIHIGRDESNDIIIDNLAVALAHAAIIIRPEGCTIKLLNDNFELVVNRKKTQEFLLNNNDIIFIGKHDIIFSNLGSSEFSPTFEPNPDKFESLANKDLRLLNRELATDPPSPTANLQYLSGKNIGKVLLLKKAMTRLDLSGGGAVLIAKRADGYYISALNDQGFATVNNVTVNDQALKLNDHDMLNIDHSSLQFFINAHD